MLKNFSRWRSDNIIGLVWCLGKLISLTDRWGFRKSNFVVPSLILAFFGAVPAFAQPARTTILIHLYTTQGRNFTGQIFCSWPSFTTSDNFALTAGSTSLAVTNGILSTTLVPTDALSGDSANARYTCRYGLTAGQPLSPPLTETWNVPTSGPVTSLDQLRAIAPPPFTPTAAPSDGTYVTKGAVSGLSAEFSLGTLVDNNILAVDVAAAVGTPRAATSTDLMAISGWPAGVDMTELGYLNGVTSAIQTQLDAKAATSALSAYLPLAGGTVTGDTDFGNATATISVDFRAGSSQGSTALIRTFGQIGALATQFDGDGVLNTFDALGASKKQSFYGGNDLFASDVGIAWKDQTSIDTPGAFDTGLGRNAAGVVEVNNGTLGTYRDLKLRSPQVTTNTEASCDSSVRGTLVMVQGGAGVADTFRVCSKDSADSYAYRALF